MYCRCFWIIYQVLDPIDVVFLWFSVKSRQKIFFKSTKFKTELSYINDEIKLRSANKKIQSRL